MFTKRVVLILILTLSTSLLAEKYLLTQYNTATFSVMITCLNENGTINTAFNATGPVPGVLVDGPGVIGSSGTTWAAAPMVTAQLDPYNNKIIIIGASTVTVPTSYVIVRYTYSGSLDTTFNATSATPGVLSIAQGTLTVPLLIVQPV